MPRNEPPHEDVAECDGCGENRRIIQAGCCADCMVASLLGGGSFL